MMTESIKMRINQLLDSAIDLSQSQWQVSASGQSKAAQFFADTVFVNGQIITMSMQETNPQTIAINNGKIIYIGDRSQCDELIGDKTEVIDLQGRTLLPGFIDPHIHLVFANSAHWVDLSPFSVKNTHQCWVKLQAAVNSAKQGEWVMCQGYDKMIIEGTPIDFSITNLDKLSTSVPIFILQSNAHTAYANSLAFQKAGVTKQTADPPHSRFVRDQNGDLTGRIEEMEALNRIQYCCTQLPPQKYVENVHKIFEMAASKGCTTLHDCGVGAYEAEIDYKIIRTVMLQNPIVRLSAFLVAHSGKYWSSLNLKPEQSSSMLRIAGVKFWIDGSLQAGSALLRQPYLQSERGRGSSNFSQQLLNKSISKYHSEGWQIGIHCNGDAAIDLALQALQVAQQQSPRADCRHRIEHCTVSHKQQLIKMKQLDVHPSFLIGHVYYYGDILIDQVLGQQRGQYIDRVKSALDCGLRPTLHSDYNCQPIDPLRCIYNAVTRRTYKTGKIIGKQQQINVYQALKAVTIDAAWQCKMDDIVGSIQLNKHADFVILNCNPLKINPQQLLSIKVIQTWMNGRRTYNNEAQ